MSSTTVLAAVKRILSGDWVRSGGDGWRKCPWWPPDLFAVVAMLAEQSGMYAEPWCAAGWKDGGCLLDDDWRRRVVEMGRAWRTSGQPPRHVKSLWRRLINEHGQEEIAEPGVIARAPALWKRISLELLVTADEACAGIGLAPDDAESVANGGAPGSIIAYIAALALSAIDLDPDEDLDDAEVAAKLALPHLPHSLCQLVPPTLCCVQPKTNTPSVGCTLRSLSHHVALLPPVGVIETIWKLGGTEGSQSTKPFNLLLVPFPYVLRGRSFQKSDGLHDNSSGFFSLRPLWLDHGGRTVSVETVAAFIGKLIQRSTSEVEGVNGVVLPETALEAKLAVEVAAILKKQYEDLELFICGVIDHGVRSDDGEALAANAVLIQFLHQDRAWGQVKHHRWRLDGPQIKQYHLGHILDPELLWWEQIDVSGRACFFNVIRKRASMAVLICEDLARFDPLSPALNAIGPNLVVALLMDGAQREWRWSGRYATVLADDPGSSVLTLTSLGMIRRADTPGDAPSRQIALWKEPGQRTRELSLPANDHALLITLTSSLEDTRTLDGRVDRQGTNRLRLSAVHGVRHPGIEFGGWPELE